MNHAHITNTFPKTTNQEIAESFARMDYVTIGGVEFYATFTLVDGQLVQLTEYESFEDAWESYWELFSVSAEVEAEIDAIVDSILHSFINDEVCMTVIDEVEIESAVVITPKRGFGFFIQQIASFLI